MKKYTVFLLAVLVFITGIIFTGCHGYEATVKYCPYCNSLAIREKESIPHYGYNNYVDLYEKVFSCDTCGKEFGIVDWIY
ncbi:hypothetical protein R84B8_00636 [Treponema sp. R8-4-B8]